MSFGQNIEMPLWIDEIPNRKDCNQTEKRDTGDIIKISQVQVPSISVFLPAPRNANGQAVVICPGGGYRMLAYDWEGTDVAKFFNSKGVAAIVLKYRLPDTESNVIAHESPLIDAKRAMRMVRYHAGTWNIDENKIGVIGFSAGGHLASMLGTHFDEGDINSNDKIEKLSCRPDFMILGYPVISFVQSGRHWGSVNAVLGDNPGLALLEKYSSELHVKENTPPTFIFHAGDDPVVPVENSLLFYQALRKKNIPTELHIYPEGGHGFALAIGNTALGKWTDTCWEWLKMID